jgi:hypothetical protein
MQLVPYVVKVSRRPRIAVHDMGLQRVLAFILKDKAQSPAIRESFKRSILCDLAAMLFAGCLCGILVTLQALGRIGAIATPSKRAQCAATITTATVNRLLFGGRCNVAKSCILIERREPSAIAVLQHYNWPIQ